MAYFRDIITDYLSEHSEDNTPVLQRAIEWLTAEIERLAMPGANAFRKSILAPPNALLDTPPATELKYVHSTPMGELGELISKAVAEAEEQANAQGFTLIPPKKKSAASPNTSPTSNPSKKNLKTSIRRATRSTTWVGLLRPPLNKASFYKALANLGLLTPSGELTELGQNAAPRVWAGIVAALRKSKYILHDYAATHTALTTKFKITLSARSLNPAQGLPAEAENTKSAMLTELQRVLGQH
jgi:hypothetical protein